jgi:hypothetical protein
MATLPNKPIPVDIADAARWEHTRRARRILYGVWKSDLLAQMELQVGSVRAAAWKCPDMTSNPLRAVCDELSHAYDVAPGVVGDAEGVALLEDSGVWPLLQRVSRDTLGLREMFVRVDVVDGELLFRPVAPDMVLAWASPDKPDKPNRLMELRLREVDGKDAWTWDVFDLSGPVPVYRVESHNHKTNLSARFLGSEAGLVGEEYPYVDSKGNPLIPYNTRHASSTGMLFDPYAWAELVEGTLNVGVLRTFLAHVIRDASWPQRYTVDLAIQGRTTTTAGVRRPHEAISTDSSPRQQVIADPAVVVELRTTADAQGQPQVGQWQTSADPVKIMETIQQYSRTLPVIAGVSPADSQRDGDPRSGFAISINRDGQREAMRRFEPVYQSADAELIYIAVALWNRDQGTTIAEDGYTVTYRGIPLSVDERRAQLEEIKALRELGLISIAQAYQMQHPGTSEEDAARAIREIRQADVA